MSNNFCILNRVFLNNMDFQFYVEFSDCFGAITKCDYGASHRTL